MSKILEVDVATKFGRNLYGRYRADGEFSGENFRERILIPSLRRALEDGKLRTRLIFTDVLSTPSSFFEEAFGGLVRVYFERPDERDWIALEDNNCSGKKLYEYLCRRLELYAKDDFTKKRLEIALSYMKGAADRHDKGSRSQRVDGE